ncbi:MAG: hypothetical protein HY270_16245 [Deltaproteobacteria bacterium]|nr:hypothetical protein [Deltaproteobacteria bacterium]
MNRRLSKPPVVGPHPVVFSWDLDKTYLKSEFDSLRELVKIPFEKPEDKIAVPGVVPLIRNLRSQAATAGRDARVFFISASPPQIAKAIKDKLALDGVEYDGITFKNQLQNIVRGKFRNLREQVGYKLTELLRARPSFPAVAREVLFGDDWESDPIIYSLYGDILAGNIDHGEIRGILEIIGVDPALIAEAETLAEPIAAIDAVERIYINLERRTPPKLFEHFGARLVPTFNYFQTACCLFQDGYLNLAAVVEVASHLVASSGYTPLRLSNSLADIARRRHLNEVTTIAISEYMHAKGLLPLPRRGRSERQPLWQRIRRWLRSRPKRTVETLQPRPAINYHELIAEWRQAR